MSDNSERREELVGYLAKSVEGANASDLFIIPNAPVYKKEKGSLSPLGELRTSEDTYALVEELYTLAGRDKRFQSFLQGGDDDFSLSVNGVNARFRVNVYRQRGCSLLAQRAWVSLPRWPVLLIGSTAPVPDTL